MSVRVSVRVSIQLSRCLPECLGVCPGIYTDVGLVSAGVCIFRLQVKRTPVYEVLCLQTRSLTQSLSTFWLANKGSRLSL